MNKIQKEDLHAQKTSTRDELRLKVLLALEENPDLTQRQLAAELGASLGGINYALKALIERGFVKANNFRKSGRKAAYLYVLTRKGIVEKTSLAAAFLGRKLEEYEMLRREIESLKGEVEHSNSGVSGPNAKS